MFDIIKKVIDKYDLCGFLSFGAPNDEYDLESKKIALLISKNSNINEIACVVSDIFKKNIDKDIPKETLIEVAREIKINLDINCTE